MDLGLSRPQPVLGSWVVTLLAVDFEGSADCHYSFDRVWDHGGDGPLGMPVGEYLGCHSQLIWEDVPTVGSIIP